MVTTTFKVKNDSGDKLGNQYILVYLTPINNVDDWLYAAWQQIRPGTGGTKTFTLTQEISAKMISKDGTYETSDVQIPPAYVSLLTNEEGLEPALGKAVLGTDSTIEPPTVTKNQCGVKNMTGSPGTAMYAQWFVNDSLTVQSKPLVSAGGTLSAFELDTKIYWSVGTKQTGPNYTYNQVTTQKMYNLKAGTTLVNVTLTYNQATNQFEWTFDPA
ncbi:hypothetical protein QUA82_18155 [Microcoleus sp. F8-D3]